MSNKAQTTSDAISENEIAEDFEQALKDGTVTDVLGNPLTKEDFREVNMENIKEAREFIQTTFLDEMRCLQGQILTIVDATFVDQNRIKYVKDLIKNSMAISASKIVELACEFNER